MKKCFLTVLTIIMMITVGSGCEPTPWKHSVPLPAISREQVRAARVSSTYDQSDYFTLNDEEIHQVLAALAAAQPPNQKPSAKSGSGDPLTLVIFLYPSNPIKIYWWPGNVAVQVYWDEYVFPYVFPEGFSGILQAAIERQDAWEPPNFDQALELTRDQVTNLDSQAMLYSVNAKSVSVKGNAQQWDFTFVSGDGPHRYNVLLSDSLDIKEGKWVDAVPPPLPEVLDLSKALTLAYHYLQLPTSLSIKEPEISVSLEFVGETFYWSIRLQSNAWSGEAVINAVSGKLEWSNTFYYGTLENFIDSARTSYMLQGINRDAIDTELEAVWISGKMGASYLEGAADWDTDHSLVWLELTRATNSIVQELEEIWNKSVKDELELSEQEVAVKLAAARHFYEAVLAALPIEENGELHYDERAITAALQEAEGR